MLAGGDRLPALLIMMAVGRSDVYGLNGRVREQLVHAGVATNEAKRFGRLPRFFRRRSEHADDVTVQAAQRFDVNGADESRADDGGSAMGDHGSTSSK